MKDCTLIGSALDTSRFLVKSCRHSFEARFSEESSIMSARASTQAGGAAGAKGERCATFPFSTRPPRSHFAHAVTRGLSSHEHLRRADCHPGVVGFCLLLVRASRRSSKTGRNLTSTRSACAHYFERSSEGCLREARRSQGTCSITEEARRCVNECLPMWHLRQVARGSREIAIGHVPVSGVKLASPGCRHWSSTGQRA
jgi:hypothetical protein